MTCDAGDQEFSFIQSNQCVKPQKTQIYNFSNSFEFSLSSSLCIVCGHNAHKSSNNCITLYLRLCQISMVEMSILRNYGIEWLKLQRETFRNFEIFSNYFYGKNYVLPIGIWCLPIGTTPNTEKKTPLDFNQYYIVRRMHPPYDIRSICRWLDLKCLLFPIVMHALLRYHLPKKKLWKKKQLTITKKN